MVPIRVDCILKLRVAAGEEMTKEMMTIGEAGVEARVALTGNSHLPLKRTHGRPMIHRSRIKDGDGEITRAEAVEVEVEVVVVAAEVVVVVATGEIGFRPLQ